MNTFIVGVGLHPRTCAAVLEKTQSAGTVRLQGGRQVPARHRTDRLAAQTISSTHH